MPRLTNARPVLDARHPCAGADPLRMTEAMFRDWLARCPDERQYARAIGGTDVGPILGLSKFANAAETWDKLLGQCDPGDSANMRRGRLMEPVIAQEYVEETRRTVREMPEPVYGTVGETLLRASPDRAIEPCREHESVGVLEIKCQQTFTFRETKTLGLDPSYYAQVQHYLALTGCSWGSVACFNPETWELHWFDVERDEEFIEEALHECDRFWREHILTRQRPAVASELTAPVVRAPRVGASEVSLRDDPQWNALAANARRAKELKDMGEQAYELARTAVKAYIESKGHEVVTGGGCRASYKDSTSRTFLKAELFRAAPLDRVKVIEKLGEVLHRLTPDNRPFEEVETLIAAIVHGAELNLDDYVRATASRTLTLTFDRS